MNECEMTEWCEAILILMYQNKEGTEQNFVRHLLRQNQEGENATMRKCDNTRMLETLKR